MVFGCATPKAPTGGPPDKKGPDILKTFPETGTTNFTGKIFEFSFSEFVNRGSVQKELVVEPDLDLEYDIKWKRKKAIVRFKDELPENTTIILTLGGNVTDVKNNKMGAPVKLAVSTGDEIDSGEVIGRIREADNGQPRENQKVLLYRFPSTIQDKATYIAETDTGGVFRFEYLRAGRYQVYAVDDRNLNKTWDQGREAARPFNKDIFFLEKEQKDTLDVLYWSNPDTLRPELQAVGLLSTNRLRLRFSEEIEYQDSASVMLTDTLGNAIGNTFPLYVSEQDPFIGFAYHEEGTSNEENYLVDVQGITDAAGNLPEVNINPFSGSAQADTVRQKIYSTNMEGGLLKNEPFLVEYTGPIREQEIIDSLVVVEGDVDFDDWPNLQIRNNRLFILPQTEWINGVDYQFLVWNPSTNRRQMFNPETWDEIDLGSIEISVEDADSLQEFHLQLEHKESGFKLDTTFSESILVNDLIPVGYKLKIFEDENGNGTWDFGTIDPFIKPEPYYVQGRVNVQRGFTSEVIIRFD